MRFRLPRPGSTWREFLAEVAIVVLGVVIALGAERLVANYLEREEARHTEAALKAELLEAAGGAVERLIVEQCLRNRLAHLKERLEKSEEHWTGDPIAFGRPVLETSFPAVYRPPKKQWRRDAWQVAMSSGVLDHMPRERVAAYSQLYSKVVRFRETNDDEFQSLIRLGPLSVDRKIGPEQAFDLTATVYELDLLNSGMIAYARLFLNDLKQMRLGYRQSETDTSSLVAIQRQNRGDCVKNVTLVL